MAACARSQDQPAPPQPSLQRSWPSLSRAQWRRTASTPIPIHSVVIGCGIDSFVYRAQRDSAVTDIGDGVRGFGDEAAEPIAAFLDAREGVNPALTCYVR